MLTDAQVWYICKVYPERVSDDEARRVYEENVPAEDHRSYWQVAARVLSELATRGRSDS